MTRWVTPSVGEDLPFDGDEFVTGRDTNIITYGGGVKDDQWLEALSRIIGEHDVMVRSTSHDNSSIWSTSVQSQPRRQRILEVADLAALPRGRMVVLASGTPAVLARTHPWQQGRHAEAIRASLRRWEPQQAPDGHVPPLGE